MFLGYDFGSDCYDSGQICCCFGPIEVSTQLLMSSSICVSNINQSPHARKFITSIYNILEKIQIVLVLKIVIIVCENKYILGSVFETEICYFIIYE